MGAQLEVLLEVTGDLVFHCEEYWTSAPAGIRMCREQSESEVSPALESEDGKLARMCAGALSLSRHAGTLCQLFFPITGVQP